MPFSSANYRPVNHFILMRGEVEVKRLRTSVVPGRMKFSGVACELSMENGVTGSAAKWKYFGRVRGPNLCLNEVIIGFFCRQEISVSETLVRLNAVYEDEAPINPLCTTGTPIYKRLRVTYYNMTRADTGQQRQKTTKM